VERLESQGLKNPRGNRRIFVGHGFTSRGKSAFFVIPNEARDLLFFAKPKKKQIPRANPALRNDSLRVFPQPFHPCRRVFRIDAAFAAGLFELELTQRPINLPSEKAVRSPRLPPSGRTQEPLE
jgi:hypothetical protein